MSKRKKREAPGLVELLRRAIQRSGKSLNQLSKDSGVAASQLSYFVRGARTLTLPAAEKVCRALRLTLVEEGPLPKNKSPGAEE
jgi:transcriptional regulator with XRE-family HTH domain